jgi:hypothetical protein
MAGNSHATVHMAGCARAWMSRLRKAWICSLEEGLKGEPSWLLNASRLTLHLPGGAGQAASSKQQAGRQGGGRQEVSFEVTSPANESCDELARRRRT